MEPVQQTFVGAALVVVAAWQWWGLWHTRPAAGEQTSTCGVNLAAFCGGALLAGWVAPEIAVLAAPVSAVLAAPVADTVAGIVTAAVVIAALDVGCRGLGLWPRFTAPQLLHGPVAALLPIVAVAGWPLIAHTVSAMRVDPTEAVAAEAGLEPAPPTVTCTPDGGFTGLVGFGPEQLTNAATIAAVGQEMGVPERGQVIALATAMQEASLRNIAWGDRDSEGLFQQRPSQGWGTPAQVTDPRYAARSFYDGLLAVPGWEAMPLTIAAQTVQRSAHPDAYAKWEDEATTVLAATSGAITCTPT